MRVYREDPREVGLRRSQDAGVTPQQWPREKGAVGRGRPKWVEPCDMDPDERGLEGCEAKGRGLDTKQCQTLWNPNPPPLNSITEHSAYMNLAMPSQTINIDKK